MCSVVPRVFHFLAAGTGCSKRSSGQHLAQSHGCRCPNRAVRAHGSPGFAAADVDLRWPLQPQKSKRCALSDTFCCPLWVPCEGGRCCHVAPRWLFCRTERLAPAIRGYRLQLRVLCLHVHQVPFVPSSVALAVTCIKLGHGVVEMEMSVRSNLDLCLMLRSNENHNVKR